MKPKSYSGQKALETLEADWVGITDPEFDERIEYINRVIRNGEEDESAEVSAND